MKYSFLTGLVLGFVGLLAAAAGYPWVQHERLPSQTEVVPNGGRAEQFLIRLPADRIGGFAAGEDAAGPTPRPELGAALSIEQFKVRNADGRVIGVAARHGSASPDGRAVAWLISIPGRGTLMLADSVSSGDTLERALERAGYSEGSAWEGELTLDTVARSTEGSAQFSAGSEEFAGLETGFSESWTVTGVDANGVLRGTIGLDTVGRRGR